MNELTVFITKLVYVGGVIAAWPLCSIFAFRWMSGISERIHLRTIADFTSAYLEAWFIGLFLAAVWPVLIVVGLFSGGNEPAGD